MKCALCNRPLYVLAIQLGPAFIGPKCAKRAGIKPNKKLGIQRVALGGVKPVHRDTQTLDMFAQQ